MDQLKTAALCAIAVALLAGCTNAPSGASSTAPVSPVPTLTRSPSPAPLPGELAASFPPDADLVGQLSSQIGTGTLGPYDSDSDAIQIYTRCVGAGSMQLEIHGVGSFPLACSTSAEDLGVVNSFDVRYVSTYSVTVVADSGVMWAVAVVRSGL